MPFVKLQRLVPRAGCIMKILAPGRLGRLVEGAVQDEDRQRDEGNSLLSRSPDRTSSVSIGAGSYPAYCLIERCYPGGADRAAADCLLLPACSTGGAVGGAEVCPAWALIGGGSALRGELVATVSRRQLHAAWPDVRRAMLAPRGRVGKKPEANHRTTERK